MMDERYETEALTPEHFGRRENYPDEYERDLRLHATDTPIGGFAPRDVVPEDVQRQVEFD